MDFVFKFILRVTLSHKITHEDKALVMSLLIPADLIVVPNVVRTLKNNFSSLIADGVLWRLINFVARTKTCKTSRVTFTHSQFIGLAVEFYIYILLNVFAGETENFFRK